MAQIEINIRRDNGTTITASSTVEDSYVAEIAMTLTALLFDSASVPATEPAPAEPAPEERPVSAAAPATDAVVPETTPIAPPSQRR